MRAKTSYLPKKREKRTILSACSGDILPSPADAQVVAAKLVQNYFSRDLLLSRTQFGEREKIGEKQVHVEVISSYRVLNSSYKPLKRFHHIFQFVLF